MDNVSPVTTPLPHKYGTIDSDYQGELKFLLNDESNVPFSATQGMCIAQLIINKLPSMQLTEATTLTKTDSDKHGFGSTGTHDILKHTSDAIDYTLNTPTTAAAAQLTDTVLPSEGDHEAYNVMCSLDPFQDSESITIVVRGKH